ncbi:MAG: nucleotidyltransferase [Candidatus Hydrogenedentota bacterium]
MDKTIKVINELKKEGVIKDYAIGGGIAAIFYIEPVLTYDLDIFFIPANCDRKLDILSQIYTSLKKKGYHFHKEHIIIEGIPVQFLPAYNNLVIEAVEKAKMKRIKKITTRVVTPEYLVAIMVQTYRPKDRERIVKFITEAILDKKLLTYILHKHSLFDTYRKVTHI